MIKTPTIVDTAKELATADTKHKKAKRDLEMKRTMFKKAEDKEKAATKEVQAAEEAHELAMRKRN